MLLLALSLHLAPAAMLPETAQARPVRTAKARRAKARKAMKVGRAPVAVRMRLLPLCAEGPCLADRNAQHRVPQDETQSYDAKAGVIRNSTSRPCGVVGAPVCPGKGMPVVRAPLTPDP